MLAAEELHQLVVVRADALQQVADRLNQLVDTESWVFPVRPQVLLAERGHAGEAGLGRFCLHTGVTADHIIFLRLALLHHQAGLVPVRPQVEGLDDAAEDRVFLQLRFGGEEGPTLRTAVGVLPGGEEAALAEVVSAGDGHRTVKGTQTDAAGQLILQAHQRKLALFRVGHDETSDEAAREKRNLTYHVGYAKTKVYTSLLNLACNIQCRCRLFFLTWRTFLSAVVGYCELKQWAYKRTYLETWFDISRRVCSFIFTYTNFKNTTPQSKKRP